MPLSIQKRWHEVNLKRTRSSAGDVFDEMARAAREFIDQPPPQAT